MLDTELIKEEIFKLYNENYDALKISKLLGLKYHQPIYNFFKKYNLKHRKIVYTSKYKLNKQYFKIINTEEKAYILGFIAADGSIAKDRLVISLSVKDIDILYKILKCINSNVPIRFHTSKNPYLKGKEFCEMADIQISSTEFVLPLMNMNLKNKTYTLNSSILKYIPKYLVRDFLRGYFDGDGNVMWDRKYNSGRKYNINICGNEEFLLNTYQKYFPSTNKMYFDIKSRQTFIWKLSSKENVAKFLDYLYCNSSIFLSRKYKEYLKSKHAHVKSDKLLENPEEDDQQPTIIFK